MLPFAPAKYDGSPCTLVEQSVKDTECHPPSHFLSDTVSLLRTILPDFEEPQLYGKETRRGSKTKGVGWTLMGWNGRREANKPACDQQT